MLPWGAKCTSLANRAISRPRGHSCVDFQLGSAFHDFQTFALAKSDTKR